MLTRPDLHEERYDPVFAAKVNPGQRVGVWMKSEQTAPAAVTVTPFVRRAMTGERCEHARRGAFGRGVDGDRVHRAGARR